MEEYLKQEHAENYMGTDDNMTDAFDNWLLQLDVDEWIELSESFAQSDYVPIKKDQIPF